MRNTYTDFKIKGWLANSHIQSMLASSKLRKRIHAKHHKKLIRQQQDVLLDAGDSVRLHCVFSENTLANKNNKLVILIHGWEGSSESTYLLSAASYLYNSGFSIIRLHLRDHGPSSHLNTELFHAARLDEVLNALKDIQSRFNYEKQYLVGFSLGGNFALRVGNEASKYKLNLQHIVAISPVISPSSTMKALEKGTFLYRQYFIKKWKRALKTKSNYFPDIYDFSTFLASNSLSEMTQKLITAYTPYASVEDYFNSYTLLPSDLEKTQIPTDIILATDDPVIPITDSYDFSSTDLLQLRIYKHGGHCGFIHNWRLESWIDRELFQLFSA